MSPETTAKATITIQTIVGASAKALQDRGRFLAAPYQHHVEAAGIYGAEAALDFIECHWPQFLEYLQACAEARLCVVDVLLPKVGGRAAQAIEDFIREQLPGCPVTTGQSQLTINWSQLVFGAAPVS